MRRTRYVALPVRAWQYVGLLVVSLACLTLGLVSRDKEGRAGSLAGPELKHQAPHEVDACPNLNPFTKMPSCLTFEQDQTRISKTTRETRDSRTSLIPTDLRMSRSRSLDRVSMARSQTRVDFRSMERSSRQGTNTEYRIQDRTRRMSDPANRLSRSLNSKITEEFVERRLLKRSTDSDKRREVNRRVNDREHNLVRSTESLASINFRRERNERSLRNVDTRNRMQMTIRRDSRLDQDRRSLTRLEQRDVTNERQRISRLDRHMDARANDRRNSPIRSLRRTTDNLENPARERRESRLVRTSEITRNDLKERRVRDLSNDRTSEHRSLVDSRRNSERRSVDFRNREEIKTDRRLTEQKTNRRLMERRSTSVESRNREDRADRRFMGQKENRRVVEQRADRRAIEQRIDRRLMEQRADRRLKERKIDRIVHQNIDRRLSEESDRRLNERRTDRRLLDQRAERRLMEQRVDRRLMERRTNQQFIEQRADRQLMERRSSPIESRTREEARTDRRLMEQRTDRRLLEKRFTSNESRARKETRTDRNLIEQRINHRFVEQRADSSRLTEQRTDRRLMGKRSIFVESRSREEARTDRKLMEKRANRLIIEQRADRRFAQRGADRQLTERRLAKPEQRIDRQDLTLRRFDTRSQRIGATLTRLANNIRSSQKEQRFAERIRDKFANDIRRSRSAEREHIRSVDRDSRSRRQPIEDTTFLRGQRSQQRNFRIPVNAPTLAVREKGLTHSNDFIPRMKILGTANFLKRENSMNLNTLTFETIRQALIIGLCTMYGLSIFYGKRSFIRNFVGQAPQFTIW
ncbi:trichohyalin-like isoform X2 [Frieseomelitta varia]|uniref:trichohyalin-like isoform X1 n=1 Tax=Frieseomelitta varia TaxID=561572 RepID=UPI001CB685A6|nr:trichohyalin-like isoform X1 [Frieseomelitta varia]XP_043507490.1 trichohyalin-like isoform X2 [Frieseomelitta varia]